MVLAEWQVGQFFWSMLWFTCFFLWIWTVIMVFTDIFRSPDMGGWGKAAWALFVIVLPIFGVLLYLLVRGGKMSEHRVREAQQADQAMQSYIRTTVATPADDFGKLTELHARGIIDDAEYESMRQRVVSS